MAKTKKSERPPLSVNIAKRRKALGWTQGKLAEKAGLGLNTIKDIERGVSDGWPDTREAIAKVLDCSVADLYAKSSTSDTSTVPTPDDLADVLRAYGRATPDTRSLVRRALGLEPDYDDLQKRARSILQTQEKTPPKASEED